MTPTAEPLAVAARPAGRAERTHNRALAARYIHALAQRLFPAVIATWIFSGGIILFEPSLYELLFLVVLGFAAVSGMQFYRQTLMLLVITLAFVPFALIAGFQVKHIPLPQALIHGIVTIFLLITTFFAANYVAADPLRRMRLIMRAYTIIAIICALIGVLAYLRLLPSADYFLLYGRAKSTFKDPNVYGPFLILPAMFALTRMLLGRGRRVLWGGVIFGALLVGVFISFSRAAWGHFAFSSLLTFILIFALEASRRDRARMLVLTMACGALLLVALAGLVSIPLVGDMFQARASVTQSYDTGDSGRFGRQGYAFDLALQYPLGLGPLEFRTLRIQEEPHNTYVTVIHSYGWGGGLCFYILVALTLWRAISGLANPRNRLLLIPVSAVYFALAVESVIIDLDHWRHYFLVMGMVWGLTTFNGKRQQKLDRAEQLI